MLFLSSPSCSRLCPGGLPWSPRPGSAFSCLQMCCSYAFCWIPLAFCPPSSGGLWPASHLSCLWRSRRGARAHDSTRTSCLPSGLGSWYVCRWSCVADGLYCDPPWRRGLLRSQTPEWISLDRPSCFPDLDLSCRRRKWFCASCRAEGSRTCPTCDGPRRSCCSCCDWSRAAALSFGLACESGSSRVHTSLCWGLSCSCAPCPPCACACVGLIRRVGRADLL